MSMKHLSLFILLLMILSAVSFAHEVDGPEAVKEEALPVETEPNTGAISFGFAADVTSKYFFRGILQENEGFIFQPAIDMYINLIDNDDLSLNLYVGFWNSFHTGGDTGPGAEIDPNDPKMWYEADLYLGVEVETGIISLGAYYYIYASPNDSFETIEELAFSLSIDDSQLFGGDFSLSPHVTLAVELDEQGDGGQEEGTYLEFGISPSFTLVDNDSIGLNLSIPVTLGLSLDNYYENADGADEAFGFVEVRTELGMPLKFVPSKYGEWEATARAHFLFLGEHADALNNDTEVEIFASAGLSMSY